MKKIKKFLIIISLLIKKPSLLNHLIEESNFYKNLVLKKHNLKQGLPVIDITEIDSSVNEKVEPFSFLDGGSTPLDLALLRILARKFKIKKYLEIGTWRGESVANISSIVDQAYTLNLSKSDLKKIGKSDQYINSHAIFSKNLSNVIHLEGNSRTFDFNSLNQKFDMIFIDGDHHYESVKKDTQTAFKLLNSTNSIIVWHDYASTPEEIRWEVLLGIFDGCPEQYKDKIFHVSNTLCAVFYNFEIKSSVLEPYKFPNKSFSLDIKSVEF